MIKLEPIELAHKQLVREGKREKGDIKITLELIKYAEKILHWTSKRPKATTQILNGGQHKSPQARYIFKRKYGSI